jgi:uncharacterized RDD family membrane protein YckC
MEKAGVALRFVAILIDAAVLVAAGIGIALLTGGVYKESANGMTSVRFELDGGPFLVWVLFGFAYYIAFEAIAGVTVGKALVGIRVVREDGSPIGWGASLVRNLLRLVDFPVFYLVGALSAWSSPKGQRVGDRAAHTLVVRA